MEVMLVDDHPLIQEILPEVIRKALGKVNVCVFGAIDEISERAGDNQVDLALVDLGLPGCCGVEAIKKFRDIFPKTRIVVISANEDRDIILSAFKVGAVGYIPKTAKQDVIIAALRVAAAGGMYVPPEALDSASVGTEHTGMTERQIEVLRLMLQGLSNQNIAKHLGIAENTVKHHLGVIYSVFGTSSRAEAMALALRRGFHPAA